PGDASPALMNPASQPHSVSLAEAISQTITGTNAGHGMVTQETSTEQLVKTYPGIAVPSHNIFYNMLGTLVKERKIYHTGEGYFTVTPNTYFIPNDATEGNGSIQLADSCCCSPPSITYLVNIQPCAHLVKENIPTVSCYIPCHCFPDQNLLCEQTQRQEMSHEYNGKQKRGCSEWKPSIRTEAENHSWDTIKSLTSVKTKLKSKMFGLGLFWRSGFKKENHKKEYSTFSAQFPPQEWPVRDEDDLDNIPRDIEHEIIKRINPALTVDNLIKHTILMQTFEEQKKCIRKEKKNIGNGTSAEVPTARQNHLSKDCVKKAPRKTTKHARQTKPKKGKQISRSSRKSCMQKLTPQTAKLEGNFPLPMESQEPPGAAVESCVVYKKQIKNPFQGLPWRPRAFPARGYQGVANRQLKCQTQKRGRAFQRLQSLAPSGPSGCATQRLDVERESDKTEYSNLICASGPGLWLKTDTSTGNPSYPQDSYLQMDNRSKYFLERNISEENVCKRTLKAKCPCSHIEDNGVCKEDEEFPFCLKDEHGRSRRGSVCELLDRTASEFEKVHLSNMASVNMAPRNGAPCRSKTNKESALVFNADWDSHPGPMELKSQGFTNRFHLLQPGGRDGGTSDPFHLDENPERLCPGRAFADTSDGGPAAPPAAREHRACGAQHGAAGDDREHAPKGAASAASPPAAAAEPPRPGCAEERRWCAAAPRRGGRKGEGAGLTALGRVQAAAAFCPAAGAVASAGTARSCTHEAGEGAAPRASGSWTEEGRNPLGNEERFTRSTCPAIPEQKCSEGPETRSVTGDSGIDSPR
ncbi:STOX1 protein, partial [Spelaeornis formosus]|nr:STOX1 protein [Elachura formosa]